jgi:hypothetical protein
VSSLCITRSVTHGHVAAVHAMARKLGLPALLGPERDLALALVISRVACERRKPCHPMRPGYIHGSGRRAGLAAERAQRCHRRHAGTSEVYSR